MLHLASLRYLSLALALTACGRSTEPGPPPARTAVVATTYPLQQFAKRILGPEVEVVLPLAPGVDPLHWEPTRTDLRLVSNAALVAANGAGVEGWLEGLALRDGQLVRTAEVFEDEWLESPGRTHSHGGGEHSHSGSMGHTWLDPLLAIQQAEALGAALARAYPQRRPSIQDALEALIEQLRGVDQRWQALIQRLGGLTLLSAGPEYAYLARRYEFIVRNLEFDASVPLTPEVRARLDAVEQRPAVLLWPAPPHPDCAAELEELGIATVVLPTLANPSVDVLTPGENYFERLDRALDDFAAALP